MVPCVLKDLFLQAMGSGTGGQKSVSVKTVKVVNKSVIGILIIQQIFSNIQGRSEYCLPE